MKYFLLACMLGASALFAQQSVNVSFTQSKEEIKASAKEGIVSFSISGATAEEVKKSASYYLEYFTISSLEQKNNALDVTLRLTSEDPMNRKVVHRMFVMLQVEKIEHQKTPYGLEEFFTSILN